MAKFDLGTLALDMGGIHAVVAEGLGTGALVLVTAGASSGFGAIGGSITGAQAAFAPGLMLFVLYLLFAKVSGGLFNPALTLGYVLVGRLPKSRLVPYFAAQFGGALVAGIILRVLLRSTLLGVVTTQMPGLAALFLEALLTFWLMFVYLAVADHHLGQAVAAAALGATLAVSVLWAGNLSGACMNPARSLGPALAAFDFSDLWIYLAGPFLGAAAGATAYASLGFAKLK